jgi:hypothetical protein
VSGKLSGLANSRNFGESSLSNSVLVWNSACQSPERSAGIEKTSASRKLCCFYSCFRRRRIRISDSDGAGIRRLLSSAYQAAAKEADGNCNRQIADLKAGDKIITTGGIIATITAVKDASFLVRALINRFLKLPRQL